MQYTQIISPASQTKFSPDSSFLLYTDTAKIYIKQCSLQMKGIKTIVAPAHVTHAQISFDSKYIAAYMDKKSLIIVYKVEDGSITARIEDSQAGILSLFWVSNSLQLMVFSQYMYKVSIYNFANQSVYYIKAPKIHTEKGFSFSSDGKFLALLQKHECKDYLSIYYTKDWKVVNTYPLDLFDAVQVSWSPNNGYLAVSDHSINYRLLLFSHMSGQVLRYEPYNYALGIKCVRFSNNSLLLAIGSYDEKIRLINVLTCQEIGSIDCSNPTVNCQKTIIMKQQQTSKNVSRMRKMQQKYFKIFTTKVSAANVDKGTPNVGIGLMQFSEDDSFIACRNDNMPYTVWIFNTSTLQPYAVISCSTQIKSIKWTKNQNYLCIVNGTDKILFWRHNGTIAQCIFTFQNKKNMNISKVIWSGDGQKAIIADKNQIVYAELISDNIQKSNY